MIVGNGVVVYGPSRFDYEVADIALEQAKDCGVVIGGCP